MVEKIVKPRLLEKISYYLKEFYGPDPSESPSYGRIVNSARMKELVRLAGSGGNILTGGKPDHHKHYFPPTLIDAVPDSSPLLKEEIFGPILPILEFTDIGETIRRIRSGPKPLMLYLFSKDKNVTERILRETSSGGVCINDAVYQFTSRHLPFGGVGESGFGQYHGARSFDAFSHKKSVMKRAFQLDFKLRYPPYRKVTRFFRFLIGLIG
jgi:aldehyde dehydrogenase (NAD+)